MNVLLILGGGMRPDALTDLPAAKAMEPPLSPLSKLSPKRSTAYEPQRETV